MKPVKNLLRLVFPTMLVLLALLIAGCNNHSDPNTGTDSDTEKTNPPATEVTTDLALVKDGKPARVLVAWGASNTVKSSAENIAQMLTTLSGKTVEVAYDDDAPYDADAVEIVLGYTCYPESQEVAKELPFGDWCVRTVGNKVIVYAWFDTHYSNALRDLIPLLSSQKNQGGNVVIAADYNKTGTGNEQINSLSIPKIEGAVPSNLYTTGATSTCWDVSYTEVNKETFDLYKTKLAAEGYTLYAENTIGNNQYQSYTKGENVLNISYIPAMRRIVVSTEKLSDTSLPPPESNNVYEDLGYAPTVTQLGLKIGYDPNANWDAQSINGLSHIIRLADGSFIVIDGGGDAVNSEKNNLMRDQLYQTLKLQAPDPEHIVIAAWFFTHAHDDHVGVFLDFDYEEVTVERFIFNFPSASGENSGKISGVYNRINESYPEAEVTHAHPGQVFYIRNAKIDIYWTLDLFYPNKLDNFNNSSIVFRIEVDGWSILYTGDMAPEVTTKVNQIYGTSLKSDIMQIPHHGLGDGAGGGSASYISFYAYVAPKYILWNSGEIDHVRNLYGNNVLLENDQFIKWIAWDKVFVITLKADQELTVEEYKNFDSYRKQTDENNLKVLPDDKEGENYYPLIPFPA